MPVQVEIQKAIRARGKRKYKQAENILLELLKKYPRNPKIHYQLAWTYDSQGKEKLAIPHYKKAIGNGLPGKDLEGAIIGLGSSYRVIGQYKKSIQILRKGIKRFPENKAMRVFLALAFYANGKHEKALALLLKNLAETTKDRSIKEYGKVLLFYANQLQLGSFPGVTLAAKKTFGSWRGKVPKNYLRELRKHW